MKNKRLVVVLGMHRSGTSAVTRGLQVLGADFGTNLQTAMLGVNEKGFFEDNDIVGINEAILLTISQEWHTLSQVTRDQLESEGLAELKVRAIELMREKMQSTNEILAIKDPRVAKLLPFWQAVFGELGINVNYVIVVRNPLSVAESLMARDQIEKEKSNYLWLEHLVPSILETRGMLRVVVDYDNMMERPRIELTRIAEALQLEGRLHPEELAKYKIGFIDAGLRHAKFDVNDLRLDTSVPQSAVELYQVLAKVAGGEWSLEKEEVLNCVQQAAGYLKEFAPALRYMTRQDWKIAGLKQIMVAHNEQIVSLNQAVANRDDQIVRLNQAVANRDDQIVTLNQAVANRDDQIVTLNQAVANRDDQIVTLNQAVANRDDQIVSLNQAVAERDEQLGYFQRRETELQAQCDELRQAIEEIRMSSSWRITKPLREASQLKQRLVQIALIFQNYRQLYPGIGGLRRLGNRLIDAIRKGGSENLRSQIALHLSSRSNVVKHVSTNATLILDDSTDQEVELPKDVAVHAHIYYPDVAPEMKSYLANIPLKFHCYVTTDTREKAKLIKEAFSDMSNVRTLDIKVVENRGRDLAPMIVELGKKLVNHDVVLHIHSKRSPHNPELRGWRRYLMTSLLGNAQRVTAILHQFSHNKQLGIMYPQIYRPVLPFMRVGGNADFMRKLLARAGEEQSEFESINQTDFPAGGMFWFRGKVIKRFVDLELNLEDFETEAGQDDATLAHAIERLFPYFANIESFYHQVYVPRQLRSTQSGAVPLGLLREYCMKGLVTSPVIIFDHNIGGGANRYSRELMRDILCKENAVLRIYQAHESWFIEWVGTDDGLIFSATSEAEMFKTLGEIGSSNIVVNSLYGYSDVDDITNRIVGLTKQLDASLDFKIHDFYPICPSQHLLDYHERYCGVPTDRSICNECLKKNPAAYWASSRTVDIAEWRSSFARLIESADVISVFDASSVEILQNAFRLETHKVKITPHNIDYFKCSKPVILSGPPHIGVLGTLTTVKGAAVVNELSQYIENRKIKIPITVIGQSLVPTMSGIKVVGHYENKNLREIVEREGINLILMPTIVPETFSYTISEAMKMRLPIVAFDIGAQGARVKQYEFGKVVPMGASPEVILVAVQSALSAAKEIIK